MDLSKSLVRQDKTIQLTRQKLRPLSLMEIIRHRCEDINDLEEVIDVDEDLERYQKDTLKKKNPNKCIRWELFENKSRLYRILRKVELTVISQPIELRIVSRDIER